MLNKGHLRHLLRDKGKASFKKNPSMSIPPASPTHVKIINVISGGSHVYRLMYSVTKRLPREGSASSTIPKSCKSDDERKLEAMYITFDNDYVYDEGHHDGFFDRQQLHIATSLG